MKRNLLLIISSFLMVFLLSPALIAQEENVEKKIEKRVKIVKVDENGKKVEIDTVLSGDVDLEEFDFGDGVKVFTSKGDKATKWTTEEGNVFIMKSGDGENIHVYSKDHNKVFDEEGVYVIKKGDGKTFSIMEVDEESSDKMKKIHVMVDEDVVHTKDGHVIMKTSKGNNHSYVVTIDEKGDKDLTWVEEGDKLKEGQTHIIIKSKGEVQDLIIEGDAVITIKDGKVKMEGDAIKMDVMKQEGESKVIKEKKVIKKEKK